MFERLKYAMLVIRSSPGGDSPDKRIQDELAEYRARFAQHWYGESAGARTVGIVLIEVTLTVGLAAFILAPLLARALNLMTERSHIVLGTFSGLVVYAALDHLRDKLQDRFSLKGKLAFLDPYFGHRITHAIRTLKS